MPSANRLNTCVCSFSTNASRITSRHQKYMVNSTTIPPMVISQIWPVCMKMTTPPSPRPPPPKAPMTGHGLGLTMWYS